MHKINFSYLIIVFKEVFFELIFINPKKLWKVKMFLNDFCCLFLLKHDL